MEEEDIKHLVKINDERKDLEVDKEKVKLVEYESLISSIIYKIQTIKRKLEWSVNNTYLITLKRFKKWFKHYRCPSCDIDYGTSKLGETVYFNIEYEGGGGTAEWVITHIHDVPPPC